jgi:hypothetical protein
MDSAYPTIILCLIVGAFVVSALRRMLSRLTHSAARLPEPSGFGDFRARG